MGTLKIWNADCNVWEEVVLKNDLSGNETDPIFNLWLSLTPPAYPGDIPTDYLRWVTPPTSPSDPGNENEVARDGNYFYVYNTDISLWIRTAMSQDWSNPTTTTTTVEPATTTTTTV